MGFFKSLVQECYRLMQEGARSTPLQVIPNCIHQTVQEHPIKTKRFFFFFFFSDKTEETTQQVESNISATVNKKKSS